MKIVLEIKREQKAVKIFAKSEDFHAWVKEISGGELREGKNDSNWKMDAYKFPIVFKDMAKNPFKSWGTNQLYVETGIPNLSFMRAKDLDKGINIEIPGEWNESTARAWVNHTHTMLRKTYRNYISPGKKLDIQHEIMEMI